MPEIKSPHRGIFYGRVNRNKETTKTNNREFSHRETPHTDHKKPGAAIIRFHYTPEYNFKQLLL